jgi:hypothetical protein
MKKTPTPRKTPITRIKREVEAGRSGVEGMRASLCV